MTATRDWIDDALDAFRATMKWSPDATDYQRTLVLGNLNGFAAYVRQAEAAHLRDLARDIRRGGDTFRTQSSETEAVAEFVEQRAAAVEVAR